MGLKSTIPRPAVLGAFNTLSPGQVSNDTKYDEVGIVEKSIGTGFVAVSQPANKRPEIAEGITALLIFCFKAIAIQDLSV
jgi:hypothetical protein